MRRTIAPPLVCLWIGIFAWWHSCCCSWCCYALSPSPNNNNNNNNNAPQTCNSQTLLSPEDIAKIANGQVAIVKDFLSKELVAKLRKDAKDLKAQGHFRPDGLTDKTKGSIDQQGFGNRDRQTFRDSSGEQSWQRSDLGDFASRQEFDALLQSLRTQLAKDLERPSLLHPHPHESTYNWYEPGAQLGRHLDEHHEETKGPKGWMVSSRRSITWLVYLNDRWEAHEGGALACHPRKTFRQGPIGAHEGNLQVGWMDGSIPVYLDAFRESGQTALYSLDKERKYWTETDFDVPSQPIDFSLFLPVSLRDRFEQISTQAKDPKFAGGGSGNEEIVINDERIEVLPEGGTLVLFDSVTLPHSVLKVTGDRQRIATTGWFHEDSQFLFDTLL